AFWRNLFHEGNKTPEGNVRLCGRGAVTKMFYVKPLQYFESLNTPLEKLLSTPSDCSFPTAQLNII
uniref:Uncharacterized protein n=1 Tax=Calidris pygmaea TaxID=425635 RepID=A0A8C3JHS9_9CHAR